MSRARFLAVPLALTLAGLAADAPEAPEPVFSGSDRRKGAALLISIEGPNGELAKVAAFAERTLGFERARVVLSATAPSAAGLSRALQELRQRSALPDQPAWIYVTGPARCGEGGASLPLRDREVSLAELIDALAATAADEKVLLLDLACEGAAPRALSAAERAGIRVFASFDPGARGAFTRAFLAGLRGSADLDADAAITFAESATYVRRWAEVVSVPAPVLGLAGRGADPLVTSPRFPIDNAPRPRGRPSSIKVEYADGEAELFVDGRPAGATPTTLADLAPGEHRLQAWKGPARSALTILVQEGEERTVVLPRGAAPEPPQFTFLSDPPGAVVSVGGVTLGELPVNAAFAPGSYRYAATRRGFKRQQGTVALDPLKSKVLVRMEPVSDALRWSVLLPFVAYEHRVQQRMWLGARFHLFVGLGDPRFNDLVPRPLGNGGSIASATGLAVLLRHTAYDPSEEVAGMEIVGGFALEVVAATGGASQTAAAGVLGANLQADWFSVGAEVHITVHPLGLLPILIPTLGVRHLF